MVHVPAGPAQLTKEELPETVDAFTLGVRAELVRRPVDVIHANYWLSGVAGHRLKHQLDLPLVSTFHTLARVKAETGDPEPQRRIDAEAEVIGCSDVILANSVEEVAQLETLYGRPSPHRGRAAGRRACLLLSGRPPACRALGLGDHPVLLRRPHPAAEGLPQGGCARRHRPDAELVGWRPDWRRGRS